MQYYGFCIPKLPHDTYTIDAGKMSETGLPKEVVLSWRGPVGETAAWLKDKQPAEKKAAYKVCTPTPESRQLKCNCAPPCFPRMILIFVLIVPGSWAFGPGTILNHFQEGLRRRFQFIFSIPQIYLREDHESCALCISSANSS